jgi:hypothetical protein
VTEAEFFNELEKLMRLYPAFTMDRATVTGDIILRRNDYGKTSARAQTMAAAFKSIMSSDPKKPRGGGGWV